MKVQAINNNLSPNFQQKFKLNEATKMAVVESTGKSIEELRTSHLHITEENIIPYTKEDVLIPRNVYLQAGRKDKSSDVKNVIDNWGETLFSRLYRRLLRFRSQ